MFQNHELLQIKVPHLPGLSFLLEDVLGVGERGRKVGNFAGKTLKITLFISIHLDISRTPMQNCMHILDKRPFGLPAG